MRSMNSWTWFEFRIPGVPGSAPPDLDGRGDPEAEREILNGGEVKFPTLGEVFICMRGLASLLG